MILQFSNYEFPFKILIISACQVEGFQTLCFQENCGTCEAMIRNSNLPATDAFYTDILSEHLTKSIADTFVEAYVVGSKSNVTRLYKSNRIYIKIAYENHSIKSRYYKANTYSSVNFHFRVKNSFEFVDTLNNITVEQDYELISLDVSSLVTNIPKALVLEILENPWGFNLVYILMNYKVLIDINEFFFDTSYLSFRNKIY